MTLKDPRDQTISKAVPILLTGRKWTPSDAVQQATSALRHSDIVGNVQLGRGGFGLRASKPTWRKASTSERRKMVVEEVRRQEEAKRSAKTVLCSKVRLQMTLKDPRDQTISKAVPILLTGRKWTPSDAVQQATSALRHSDIVGNVQLGRGGFGLRASKPTWRKASTSERRKMVVEEVRRQEEAKRSAKTVLVSSVNG
ncbi:hypothetical protein DPX16_2687 [Anabarilius grahami]|uniref:Uncharacterized protein n=1 Tax=Anabarilius grahami TaxID=495550 RepID=A0A3N0YPH9_ANAGA|nr:hypothetical protein DPX16_2687 [Anabarilius grahami]